MRATSSTGFGSMLPRLSIRGEILESRSMLAAVTEDLLGPDAILEDLFPGSPSSDEVEVAVPGGGELPPIPAVPYDDSLPTSGSCPSLPAELCLPGDLNGDRTVDLEDFLKLSGNFGVEDAGWAEGDLDGDGLVSFADFMILSEHFGQTA